MSPRAAPIILAILLAAAPAAAQQPTDPPTGVAVPRGAGGAVVKQQDDKKAPDPNAGITMPRAKNYKDPEYPPDALKQGLEAKVLLLLDVSKEGKVLDVKVLEPAGHGFDEAAVAAAYQLDFEPARNADGSPFRAQFKYRYTFTSKEAPPPAQTQGQGGAAEQKDHARFSGVVLAASQDGGHPKTPRVEVPIVGATVSIGSLEARADEKGAFSFSELAPGKYNITVRAPGYETLAVEETLAAGEALEVKYRLFPSSVTEVTVHGDRPPREVTKRTVEQREISRIPGTNGDAIRSLQNLPGVARPPGVLGVLIVRGSAPQDTQTFIDGTPVPLIYHFGGLSSVVPTEILDKIDFYPGNFSAQYGRVQGGIVDVGLRAPKSDYHGLLQIDLIDARAMVEGKIPGLDGWTFLAAGRRSYVDAWLGPVLTSAGAGITQAPVYYDYQFMIAKNPTPDSTFRVAFFGSDDNLKLLVEKPSPGEPALAGNVGLHTAFQRLQMRYTNNLPSGDRVNAVLAFGRDEVDFGLGSLYFLLDLRTVTGRAELSKHLLKGVTLNAGVDMEAAYYDVHVRLPAPPAPGEPPNGPFSTRTAIETRLTGPAYLPAGHLEMEIAPTPRARIVPGVRLDYFNVTKQFDFSPRVSARYDIVPEYPKTTVKAGVGLFHQPPQFQEVTQPYGNPNLKSNRAIQYSLGVEQQLNQHIDASLEGFYKQLDNAVVSTVSPSGAAVQYTNDGSGYVVGSELLIKYKPDDHFFGWLAYTLSRSVRRDGPGLPEHLVQFDQTHILTILGSYRLGGGWEFGARFRLISGNLITPDVCDAFSSNCDSARTNALFNAAAGVYTPIPLTNQNSERLPLFHQLDIRVDKSWRFKRWSLSAYLDVQNAYNHGNVEGIGYNYNYTARQYVAGLPILPSIGIRGEL